MSEPRRRGRKRIHPVGRKRRNLNIERDATLDADLLYLRQSIAKSQNVVNLDKVTQTDAIKAAVKALADYYRKAYE